MISDQDFDRLSAYLDNQLSTAEQSALETRLAREPELKAALVGLRMQLRAMRDLPHLRPPRNFTLTAEQARTLRRPSLFDSLFPALRLATSLSAAAFVLVLAAAVMTPAAAPVALAPTSGETARQSAAQPAPLSASPEVALQNKTLESDTGAASTTTENPPAAGLVPQTTLEPGPMTALGVATDTVSAVPTSEGFSIAGIDQATPEPSADGQTPAAVDNAQPPAAPPEPGDQFLYQSETTSAPIEAPAPAGYTPLQWWAAGLAGLTAVLALLTWFSRRR